MKIARGVRLVLLAAGAALALGSASSGGNQANTANNSGTSQPVKWTVNMDGTRLVVPALKAGARNAGCNLIDTEDHEMGASCQGVAIAVVQSGRQVTIGCSKVNESTCRNTFKRILNATPVSD